MITKRSIQILSVGVLHFSIFTCASSFPIVILAMTNVKELIHYNWTTKQVNWILNAPLMIITLSIIPNNYLPKFFRLDTIMSLSVFVMGISYLIIPFAAQYGWWCIFFLRILHGNFHASYLVCSMNMLSNWALNAEKARMMAVVNCGQSFGSVFGSAAAGIIIGKLGWHYVFFILGSVACFWAISMKFVLNESPVNHPTITDTELSMYGDNGRNNETHTKFHHPPWWEILKSPAVWAINCATFSAEFASIPTTLLFPMYLTNIMQIDVAKTGFFISISQMIGWLTLFPMSWGADYLIKYGKPVVLIRRIFTSIYLLGWAAIIGLLCYTKSYLHVFLLTSLKEIFRSAYASGPGSNPFDICPTFVGSIISIEGFFISSVHFISPIISSFILQDPKNEIEWHTLFLIAISLLCLGNSVFLILAKGEPQKWDPVRNRKSDVVKNDK